MDRSHIRVAAVDFINTLPLIAEFLDGRGPRGYSIERHTPAECASLLARGEVELGLIPSIEFARIPDLKALPGMCIAAEHEVRSVIVLSRRPLREVSRVAVDPASRTSVALLSVLLRRERLTLPELTPWNGTPETALAEHEAVLLIGDAALRVRRGGYFVVDLASEWVRLTGRPFVFAFWAVRGDVRLPGPVEEFIAAQRRGLQTLDWRITDAARRAGVSIEEARLYFRHHLHYEFGELERDSLEHFYRLATETGVISSVPRLEFYRDRIDPDVARAAG